MTEDRCRYTGATSARVLVGRHRDGCDNPACEGCQECTRAHCRVCSVTHSAGVCGGCMTAIRDDLADIERMYDELWWETTHRGVNSEAMNLAGPVADVEAWGHHEASAAVGRTAEMWTDGNDDLHPLWVAGNWAGVYREAFDHDEPTTRQTVATEVSYLGRNLEYAATWPHVPVEDMARDLRRCRGHLARVIHDENDGDRANVGCFECGGDLERRLTTAGFEDFWTCRRCRRTYTPAEYNFALRAKIEEEAEAS